MIREQAGAAALVLAALLAAGAASTASAETVYIRDQLYVPLRGGQSSEYRIVHAGVPSGTPLELLETNGESGYSRVRMEDGVEGWIQSQYLTDTPIARDQLEALQARYAQLQDALEAARKEIADGDTGIDSLREQLDELKERNEGLAGELSRITRLATDSVELDERNRALKEQNRSLVAELDNLTTLNMELESRKQREWYWLGAGTVLISALFGIWIGRKIYFGRTPGGWS